jgi:hypothetical protein
MTVAVVITLISVGIVITLGAWYLAANRIWYRLLREREADLEVDAVAEPGRWVQTAPSRLRLLLASLGTPAADDQLEYWRRRTVNRAVGGVVVVAAVVLLGPLAVVSVASLLSTELERGGTWFAIGFAICTIGGLGYFVSRLAIAVVRFGNGEPVPRAAFIISLVGITAFIAAAALVATVPVGSV